MTNETSEEFASCADCGCSLDPALERGYGREDWVLCWRCAVQRGGSYDENEDTWTVEPRVHDLLASEHHVR